jgi:hypothetical protein
MMCLWGNRCGICVPLRQAEWRSAAKLMELGGAEKDGAQLLFLYCTGSCCSALLNFGKVDVV